MTPRLRPFFLSLYRAAVVVALALLVHAQARWFNAQRSTNITLAQARRFFPAAEKLRLRDPERGLHYATDVDGNTVGLLLTTSPETDDIKGYAGPNNLLIALSADGAIAGVELLQSSDTPEHVELIRKHPEFFQTFKGWRPAEAVPPRVAGVAGATLTSYAIVEAVQKRLAGAAPSLRFPDPITLKEVKTLFTNAASIKTEERRLRVLDSTGRLIGFVARTSPQADNVSGYRGPTEAIVALALDGKTVTAVRVRSSYDTGSYVDQIRNDENYLKFFEGKTIDQIAALDYKRDRIEGVSGATQTSFALAEGLKRRFASDIRTRRLAVRWKPRPHDWALAGVVAGACAMAFTPLRGRRWVRLAWQALLIGYVGFASGDLLSLSLFGGWATNGLAARAAPGLALLAVAAFVLPLATRRQLYCHHICPHGAAQQWLGALDAPRHHGRGRGSIDGKRPRWMSRVLRIAERLPVALLLLALCALLFRWPLDLSQIEPFDAWVWRSATVITLSILAVGLVASVFVPQAYCRFGCPTGALLAFLRSSGSGDRWGRRDWSALVVLIVAFSVTALTRRTSALPEPEPGTVLHGKTMGTTWTVKLRDTANDTNTLQRVIAAEYDRIEFMTSHWRSNTPLSEINRTRATNSLFAPPELLSLVRWSTEISQASGGAFDITVGPLVKLWGFGPAPRRDTPPTDAEIEALRSATGWNKIEIRDGMLRKLDPGVELDLSAIVPGWANDRIATLLEKRGVTNYLVESGGELRAGGVWKIGIEHPTRSCTLSNESIGTSGTYRQNWKAGGRTYSHLLDPRTGRPVTHNTVSVSVRMADCAHADAWGAALNVMGVETGLPLAERLGLAAQFVIEQPGGKLVVRQTKAWR